MVVFIYVAVADEPSYSYENPFLSQVKKQFPEIVYLDIDSFSDDFLVTQACQLVEQAEVCVVYFTSTAPAARMGSSARLAEVLIRKQNKSLVGLQGANTRIERLFTARTHLSFLLNPGQEMLLTRLASFLP